MDIAYINNWTIISIVQYQNNQTTYFDELKKLVKSYSCASTSHINQGTLLSDPSEIPSNYPLINPSESPLSNPHEIPLSNPSSNPSKSPSSDPSEILLSNLSSNPSETPSILSSDLLSNPSGANYGNSMNLNQFTAKSRLNANLTMLESMVKDLAKLTLVNNVHSKCGKGTLVCGSFYKFAPDPTLCDLDCICKQQVTVWAIIVFEGEDQLCQRMAWSLHQLPNTGMCCHVSFYGSCLCPSLHSVFF